MNMIFSTNGSGRPPAPPLLKSPIKQIIVKPSVISYTIFTNNGMFQRIEKKTNCSSCGK
uniref:Uncharacterized protein n=1 Tax=viral metagenome TaxID=1070528 RepID=A0A6C0JK93_9ZZZZ